MLETIGPYKFISVLGRGGMGTVFKGEHEDTGELHAVKVLAPNYSQETHFRARFESEIQALIKLDHPNIVRLISFGQEAGNLFFAMEMVDGKSLFEVQRSGHRFTPPQCLSIAKDVCKGLKHAHDRGIIHRDLKPGNLMLGKDRVVKITDFGIAKSFGTSQNTGNNILGTMDFMSPEQARGEQVTAKSDIYSLGTVLFTLLSGKPPFSGNSIEESFRNLTRVPAPNIRSIVPDVPPEIDELIRKMMEKKPEKRIATAQAALHQINEAEERLKNYSEAKTAQHSPDQFDSPQTSIASRTQSSVPARKPDPQPDTRISSQLSAPIKNKSDKTSAEGNTAGLKNQKRTHLQDVPETSIVTHGQVDAIDGGEDFTLVSSQNDPEPIELDYFNTVTEEEREIVTVEPDLHRSQGVGWLLTALLLVIAVSVGGAWYTTRNPTADELYSQIERSKQTPELAVEQTQTFITLYPQDDRFEEVLVMNEVGKSIDFYHDLVNKLSVRARIPGESRMTEIEDQFHDIIRLADDDLKAANAKMAAFIVVHANDDDLAPRDRDCVMAAKGFRLKHKTNNASQIKNRVNNIHAALQRASNLNDDFDAIKIYRSLLQLHQNDYWGDQDSVRMELMQQIKQRIKEITTPDSPTENLLTLP